MTEKIDELANRLYEVWNQKKSLEQEESTIKDAIKKYFEKSDMVKYTSNEYILEMSHRMKYGVPPPDELRKLMGNEFASHYIEEVVNEKVRNDLPPSMQNQLCPCIKDTAYIAVRPRKGE